MAPAVALKASRGSFILLIVLALIALGMIVLPRPAIYYPNIVIDATGDIQADFLLTGRQGKTECEATAASMASAINSGCPACRIRSQVCLRNPSAEFRQRFSETPLPVPSARMANGIVTYSALQPDLALLACQESERQAARNGGVAAVVCYPAGATRVPTAFEKHQDQATHTMFTLLLALIGGLVVSLVLAIAGTYIRRQRILARTATGPAGITILPAHPWLEKVVLAGLEAIILLSTFLALSWPAGDDISRWTHIDRATVFGHGVIIILTVGWFWLLLEHYARRRPFWDELREIFHVLTVMFMISGAAAFVVGLEAGRSSLLIVWALNFILIPVGRAGARQLLGDLGLWQRPAVIIGTGENARDAHLAIKSERGMGYRILGFVNTSPGHALSASGEGEHASLAIGEESFPVFTPEHSLESLLAELGTPQVILALDSLTDPANQSLVQRLLGAYRNIHIVPSLRGLPLFGTQISHFFSHEVLFLTVRNNLSRRGFQWIKRVFDIVGASVLLVVLSPLMGYVAWRIWREDGGPVIFHQPRLAKDEGEFGFLKFRSMVNDADRILAGWRETNSPEWQAYYANNFKLKNDPRVLGVGSWIRALSIDELPQLINVLRGQMSLVGPRPLLARELPEYGESITYYRQARPGITGLWQISGRSQTQFSDRAVLDEWYVKNWSVWYDIAILFKTAEVVFQKRGAY